MYDYKCETCEKTVTLIVRRGEEPPQCETCGDSMEQLISSPSLSFKGDGFYVTDYKREGS